MPRLPLVFILLALLALQARATALAGPPGLPMRLGALTPTPLPGGPPPPGGPRDQPLSFEESLRFAMRAAGVARQLQAGILTLRPTPQGQRLTLTLTYLGRPVSTVTLRDDLSFADRPAVPLLPDTQALPTLSSDQRTALVRRVAALATSGLAQATGPHIRVALLSDGAAVADLRFDRATGILLAEPPERVKPAPPDSGATDPKVPDPKKPKK